MKPNSKKGERAYEVKSGADTEFAVLPGEDPPREVLIERSAGVLNDEFFARELEFEERIDATMQRALDQLEKIKAAKRRITFLEARRFAETHPRRLGGFKVVEKRVSRGQKE